MNENEPQLPEDLRKVLKQSPTLTPPESFYQEVLERIERGSEGAKERKNSFPLSLFPSFPRWNWNYAVKGMAAVCVLMVIVLAVREKNTVLAPSSSPAGTGGGSMKKIARMDSPPATGGNDEKRETKLDHQGPESLQSLDESKEVQGRLHRSISGLVENPSPFEEEDAELRKQLKAKSDEFGPVRIEKVAKAAPVSLAGAPASPSYAEQARDTVSGIAAQNSFMTTPLSSPLPAGRRAGPAIGGGSMNKMALMDSLPEVGGNDGRGIHQQEWKGMTSGITTFRTVVVHSSEEWQALWREKTSYIVPPPPAPDVDFGSSIVVGIFDGAKNTGGYAVNITDIRVLSDKVVVLYRESRPPAGMATVQVLTQPYHLRVIPKTSLPITFQKEP